MTLLQALRHFIIEAALNMRRSWRVSLLAVLVTAVSLFLAGALFLLGSNLDESLASWEAQARIVVYLEPGAPAEDLQGVEVEVRTLPGVVAVHAVSSELAEERLRQRAPGLSKMLEDLEDAPLPASFEIELDARRASESLLDEALEAVRQLPSVSGVDDDRRWIEQIAFASVLLRSGAALIGALLIAGSVFIIASVIRLAALLHREEIRVLRLVGATEFFVRGPFVVQGVLQGIVGSLVALLALGGFFFVLEQRQIPALLRSLLLSSFLSPLELTMLLVLGTGAGLVGGVLSVRRTAAGLW